MVVKKETEWDNIIVSKEKTDWYWVMQMLALGAFGIAICYYGKLTGMLWERVDELRLKVELLTIDAEVPTAGVTWKDKELPLPQRREKTVPSMFEQLGIDKNGQFRDE